jgi:hypothetical protein
MPEMKFDEKSAKDLIKEIRNNMKAADASLDGLSVLVSMMNPQQTKYLMMFALQVELMTKSVRHMSELIRASSPDGIWNT